MNSSAAIFNTILHESTTKLAAKRDLSHSDSIILPVTTRKALAYNKDHNAYENHSDSSVLNRKRQTKAQRRFARIKLGHNLDVKPLLKKDSNAISSNDQITDTNKSLFTGHTWYRDNALHLDKLLNGSDPILIDDVWQIYANNRHSINFLYTISLLTFRRLLRILEWRHDKKTSTHTVIIMKSKTNDKNNLLKLDTGSNVIDPDNYRAQQADRILQVIKDMRTRGLRPPDSAYRALMRDATCLTNVKHKTWFIPAHDMTLRKELLRVHFTIFRLKRDALRKMLHSLAEETAYMDKKSLAQTKNTINMDIVEISESIVGRVSYQQIINMTLQSHQRSLALLAYNDSIYYGTGIGAIAERQLWQLIATRPSSHYDISLFASIRHLIINHQMERSTENLVSVDTTAHKTRNATAQLVANNNLIAATQIVLSFYKDGIAIPVHLLNQLLVLLCEAGSLKSAVALLAQACTANTAKYTLSKHIQRRPLWHRSKTSSLPTHPDAISFNAVADAFVDQGNWDVAHRIIRIAIKQGIKPTSFTANIQFKADLARQMEQSVIDRAKTPLTSSVHTAGRSSLTVVEQTLNAWLTRENIMNAFQPDVCTYNICFGTLLMKDNGLDAFTAGSAAYRLVRQMKAANITPNLVTCNMLLQLFGHKRDHDAFTKVIKMMMEHRLTPNHATQSILLRYSDASWWRRHTLPPTA
jgi:pentatricopeptide repeat protein